ncbi:MAG: ABC transporter permease [Gemmatimonadota bacterium]
MHFREGVRLALLQIRQEKLKSAFSLLGVVIGIMFLVVVVSVVEGMDRYMTETVSQQIFGINTVTVRRTPNVQVNTNAAQRREWSRRPRVTVDEAEVIREALTVPALVGVEANSQVEVRSWDGRGVSNSQISAMSAEMLEIRNLLVERGRPFSVQEVSRSLPVAILGTTVADALFPDSDALGQRIRVRDFPYRVVGILESQGTMFGQSLDNRVVVPVRSAATRQFTQRGAVGSIVIQALDPADLPVAMMDTEAAMRVERRLRPGENNNFALDTAEDSLAFWDRISTILFLALPGLVGISLVVGGIVIMNIMLVSVMERTREIGVRKALGAQRKDIINQFLVEATTLSAAGAFIGVVVGILLTWVVRTLTPLPAAVAPQWLALGVFIGMSVGIIAGVYPAIRASQLDPVVALRHE